jgi:3-phenylpropionate/trans-cinnamate dioxygenase ferredoxin subunit
VARYVVATVDELPPGTRKIVEVAGRQVGVFNVGGELFALRNRCPHQGGPLCEGRLAGQVEVAAPGDEIEYSRPGEILRCPWHSWEYDIRTGQSWFDPTQVRVRAYEVAVEPGQSLAESDLRPAAEVTAIAGPGLRTAGTSALRKGPYVAETYPVSLENQYVVVEIEGA